MEVVPYTCRRVVRRGGQLQRGRDRPGQLWQPGVCGQPDPAAPGIPPSRCPASRPSMGAGMPRSARCRAAGRAGRVSAR